ncbi:unnamed protein product [Adineta ricciae]|uniref:Uncharacterized protein n=1 Tax=Adineta ricciae TaxID=249248 RepID=A0A815PTZ7_ADIRI|nr:unnamed protein product [Adineta ricciae]
MSNVTTLSADQGKKRPSVSSKCLLNIKSIVAQNVSANRNSRNSPLHLAPLPLADDKIPSKEPIGHVDGVKDRKSKLNAAIESLQTSSMKVAIPENGNDQLRVQTAIIEKQQEEIQSRNDLHDEASAFDKSSSVINTDSTTVPPLPLDSSMYPFCSPSSLSAQVKPLLSFPAHSSTRINEEYLRQMRHIIETSSSSSTNSSELKPIELPIHIHRFDSTSPSLSTVEVDKDRDIDLHDPLIFPNNSSNLTVKSDTPSSSSDQSMPTKKSSDDHSKKMYYNQSRSFTPNYPTSYARLPHSLRQQQTLFNSSSPIESPRLPIANPPINRRSFPHFESVRTPAPKATFIDPDLFDCCQSENIYFKTETIRTRRSVDQRHLTTIETTLLESEARSNYFRDVKNIREIMLDASKRLTTDNNLMLPLSIVDTHCHFDLIFDRLHIRHNNLTKYFKDYNEYYPPGLSFELAIQVFWRPQQLTEKNWNEHYSKYLDDERVYGSCGIHPHWSASWNHTSVNDIERCLQHPKIVAIGEIGLDFGPKNTCARHEQYRAFEAQLKLATKWSKPIVIHARDAHQEAFPLMKKYLSPDHKIHLHCFVGTMDDVNLYTSYFKEIKFGFTPLITRKTFSQTVIQQLKLTQILSETDSPYFIPDELSTYTRCAHPGMVYSVVETVAKLRQLPVNDVADQLRANARQIYGV